MIDDELEQGVIILYDGIMICTSTHVKRYADEQIKNLSVDILIVSNQSITLPRILNHFNKTLPHLSHTRHTLSH